MYRRLTKIDTLMLRDHYYLESDDHCTFMGEYTARGGFDFGPGNQLIANFKKSPKVRNTDQWPHKIHAITTVAESLAICLEPYANELTLVPVPPSKKKSHIEYDDRLLKSLMECKKIIPNIDYRELVIQTVSTDASHNSANRKNPNELKKIYSIDTRLVAGTRNTIIIYDDMITAGSHFKAMQLILRKKFPNSNIAGLFVTRRIPNTDDL